MSTVSTPADPTSAAGDTAIAPASLSVSIVTFQPDLPLLRRTVESLAAAITAAERALLLSGAYATLIDNTGSRESIGAILHAIGTTLDAAAVEVAYRHEHGNIGYGAGHNLALLASRADYHLVLNPDVLLDPDAIANALRYLQLHPDVGVLTPAVSGADGAPELLAKRRPAVLDLALRGFAPPSLRARFRRRLDRYVGRDRPADRPADDLEVASGCCMFLRGPLAREVGGFDERFFLYFEDFDLAARMRRHARIAYVPEVRIVHFGGGAAGKGFGHLLRFARSAVRYFFKHGWRIT